jgi:HK97 family phage major capsid protein
MELSKKSNSELQTEIEALESKCALLRSKAQKEQRDLSTAEASLIQDCQTQVKDLRHELLSRPGPSLTFQGPKGSRSNQSVSTDDGGFESVGEIMSALYRKSKGEGFDERLRPLQIKAATQIGESVPSEGGFAIPTMFIERALNEDLEDTVLLQLCDRQIMTTNEMTVPGFTDDNHSATAPFGITWTQIAEGASFGATQGTPFRSMTLNAKKSGALFLVNNEWLADASSGLRTRLENIWRASLRWYVEDLLWAGSGVGQALGALVGGGAVSVGVEVGQHDNTIVTENVVNMWARLRPGSHSRAIWAANQTCFPALATLSLAVGTGGAPVGILQTNASVAGAPATSIFGRPLYLSEHLPSIGNSGDLVLLDPLLYLLGDRKAITLDASPHLKFDYDQTVFRASARLDAQPIYDKPLTPKNGETCGWLVKIDDRT